MTNNLLCAFYGLEQDGQFLNSQWLVYADGITEALCGISRQHKSGSDQRSIFVHILSPKVVHQILLESISA